jgi:hypothetical protein
MTSIPDTGPTIKSPSQDPFRRRVGNPHRRVRGECNKQREEDIAVRPLDLAWTGLERAVQTGWSSLRQLGFRPKSSPSLMPPKPNRFSTVSIIGPAEMSLL